MPCCRSLVRMTNVSFQQSSLGAPHLANQIIGNIAASEPDVSACFFPIASSTFSSEGKGSQARVWYKVMCRRYSYRLSRKRLVLVCFSKALEGPLRIYSMSYPRGDTFLIPVNPVGSVCPRSVADVYIPYTHSAPDRRHVRDDDDRFHFGMAGKIQDDIHRCDMEET